MRPHTSRALVAACLVTSACADSRPPTDVDDPPASESGCPAADLVAAKCPLVSTSYLSLATYAGHNEVVVVDAASGATCSILAFPTSVSVGGVSALGVMGSDVFFCAAHSGDNFGILTRLSLTTGEIVQATTTCLSITAYGGKIVMLHEQGTTLEMFGDVGQWMSPQYVSVPQLGTRLGYGDNKLYSTTMPLETIAAYDPATRTSTSFDMPPNAIDAVGLAANGGAVTLLDGNPDTQVLISLDATTGDEIERVPVDSDQPTRLHGLANACSGTGVIL